MQTKTLADEWLNPGSRGLRAARFLHPTGDPTMEETFYCGRCGRFRLLSERCSSPAGIRPVCVYCRNKAINNLKRSEKSRDARRAKSVGKIEHLIPKEVD